MRVGMAMRLIVVCTFIAAVVTVMSIHRSSAAPPTTVGAGSCVTTISSTTGVTASTTGSDCVLSFTSTSTSFTWTSPPSVTSMRILVIGGGGGGGSRHAGGGGAGGMLTSNAFTVTPLSNYTVAVGAGGSGASSSGCGTVGSTSQFGTVVANGGGPGCSPDSSTAGGSSGGTANNSDVPGAATPGTVNGQTVAHNATVSGVTGYGNVGGYGFASTCENAVNPEAWCGGGGGGAGSAGSDASASGAGGGGAGRNSSITGTSKTYAAGGGGAGGLNACAGTGALGGAGGSNIGGLGGGYDNGEMPAGNGTANTGSGGGGGAYCGNTDFPGGNGGSGIVIVRWTPDTTKPAVSSWTAPTSPTKNRSLNFTLDFDESISDLTSSDFSNSGTATCTFSPNTSSGTSFTVAATCTTDGTVIPTLAINSVNDLNSNSGPTTASSAASVSIDTAAPTVTWGASATQTSTLVMQFSFTTSKAISGLATSDFTTTGTATGCTLAVSTSTGSSFTVDATCTSPGTVALQLAALSVSDALGNNGPTVASDSPSATIPKLAQATLTVTSTNATYGQQLALTTSGGNGGGAVTWQKISGQCSVTNSTLTPSDAGSLCEVRATKAGDDSYLPKDSAGTTITIGKGTQSNFAISSANTFISGTSHTLTSSGSHGTGTVTWSLTSGSCSLTGSILIATSSGITCSVTAQHSGDTNYFAATATQTITVTAASTPTNSPTMPPVATTTTVALPSPTNSVGQQAVVVASTTSTTATLASVIIAPTGTTTTSTTARVMATTDSGKDQATPSASLPSTTEPIAVLDSAEVLTAPEQRSKAQPTPQPESVRSAIDITIASTLITAVLCVAAARPIIRRLRLRRRT